MEQLNLFNFLKEPFFNSSDLSHYLDCLDHTVSGEKFELLYNKELDMLLTSPRPKEDKLPFYYESQDYISHTDSKASGLDKLYQQIKYLMIDKKLGWIEARKEIGTILDIGAGTGDFLARAKYRGWKIEGVEPNIAARKLAVKKEVELNQDSSQLNSGSFDVITMWHVLEHVYDLEKQILQLQKLLKEDGLLVIAVPNFRSYDAKKYQQFWAAYDVPRHLWHFSKNSIEKLFGSFDFGLVKTKPLIFDAFYVSLLSEKYRHGNMRPFSAFMNGAKSNLTAKRTGEYSSLVYFLQRKDKTDLKPF